MYIYNMNIGNRDADYNIMGARSDILLHPNAQNAMASEYATSIGLRSLRTHAHCRGPRRFTPSLPLLSQRGGYTGRRRSSWRERRR